VISMGYVAQNGFCGVEESKKIQAQREKNKFYFILFAPVYSTV